MTTNTKKVWALVEIADEPYHHGEVVGGVDIEKAQAELVDLYKLRLGDAPRELFNTSNPMYTPRRKLGDVIREDYKRNPDEFIELWASRRSLNRARQPKLAEHVAEWQQSHPAEQAMMVEQHGAQPGVEAYLRLGDLRQRRVFERLMDDAPITPMRGWAQQVAEWLDIPLPELCAKTRGDDDAPFFSEGYLYPLLGKEHARTVLGYLRAVAVALGVKPWEIDYSEIGQEADT